MDEAGEGSNQGTYHNGLSGDSEPALSQEDPSNTATVFEGSAGDEAVPASADPFEPDIGKSDQSGGTKAGQGRPCGWSKLNHDPAIMLHCPNERCKAAWKSFDGRGQVSQEAVFSYMRHVQKCSPKHNPRLLYCGLCGLSFRHRVPYSEHLAVHERNLRQEDVVGYKAEGLFYCPKCPMTYCSLRGIQKHVSVPCGPVDETYAFPHNPKLIHCPVCADKGCGFKTIKDYDKHLISHGDQRLNVSRKAVFEDVQPDRVQEAPVPQGCGYDQTAEPPAAEQLASSPGLPQLDQIVARWAYLENLVEQYGLPGPHMAAPDRPTNEYEHLDLPTGFLDPPTNEYEYPDPEIAFEHPPNAPYYVVSVPSNELSWPNDNDQSHQLVFDRGARARDERSKSPIKRQTKDRERD